MRVGNEGLAQNAHCLRVCAERCKSIVSILFAISLYEHRKLSEVFRIRREVLNHLHVSPCAQVPKTKRQHNANVEVRDQPVLVLSDVCSQCDWHCERHGGRMGQPWWWCHFASVAFWVEHTVLGFGLEGLGLPEKAGRLVCMRALFGSGNTVRLRVLHAIRQEVVG